MENENKNKPFHQNKNDTERLNWFKKTRPWNEVDEKIINGIIKKFNGDPMLEVFVITSMKHNLVPLYCKLNNSEYVDSPDVICSLISQTLCSLGSNSLKQVISLMDNVAKNQDKFKHHYSITMDSLETAIILDNKQVGAYLHLAITRKLLNKYEDGLKYAKQGLAIIKEIKASDIPFHLSKVDMVKNAKETFAEIEKNLTEMILEFQEKLDNTKT